MNDDRNPDDVTWLDATFGLAIDLIDGRLDDGVPRARAARLTMVFRNGGQLDEQPMPAAFDAPVALELAQLLMAAATVINPDLVAQHVARAHLDRAADRALAAPLPAGERRH